MIIWQSIVLNSLWILGLAIMLAALSYHYWLAGHENRQLRLQLSQRGFLRPICLGSVLVGIALVGTSQQSWEMAIWGAMTLIALIYLIILFR